MNLYEFAPQKNVKRLSVIISILFFGAAGVLLITFIGGIPFKWAFQLAAILLLAVGVFLTSRYVMRAYIYRIEATDGGRDLTVTEVQGKSVVTVCRLGLGGIASVHDVGADETDAKKELRERARSEGAKVFDYCVDISSPRTIWVLASECGEPVCIKLSYEEKLFLWLSDIAEQKKADA